jgi:hypothetical protein
MHVLKPFTLTSMTRLVRAQYEDDDIAEANIVCRISNQRDYDQVDSGSELGRVDREAKHTDTHDGTMSRITQKFRTLRLPAWINFSYSTIPRRAPYARRRSPNPFGPHGKERLPFGPLGSLDGVGDNGEASTPSQDVGTILSAPLQASPASEHQNPLTANPPSLPPGPVESHPPIAAWDDNSIVHAPYNNPFYTRSIDDTLWLPRDPFGTLDLDDTVDLRVSLTTEPSAGRLGEWHRLQPSLQNSPIPGSRFPTTFAPSITDSVDHSPVRRCSGHEGIMLPPGIASRVTNLVNEDDVERVILERRPSLFGRRYSSSKDKASTTGFRPQSSRRSTVTDRQRPPPLDLQPSSTPSERDSRITSSHLSAGPSQQRVQSGSAATQFWPDAHVQASRAQSTSPFAELSHPSLHHSSGTEDSGHTRHITTQEAVLNEVIAEEQEAAEERLKEEQAEANHANGKRSQLIAWIYAKIH